MKNGDVYLIVKKNAYAQKYNVPKKNYDNAFKAWQKANPGVQLNKNRKIIDENAEKKVKKDKNAPKAAKSAYIFFCADHRPAIMKKNPEIKFGEVGKALGAKWKSLNENQKTKYKNAAKLDKSRFNGEMLAYNKTKSQELEKANNGKKKKDKNVPKAAKSAYLVFCAETRASVVKRHPNLTFGEIGKQLGAKWKSLTQSQKNKFENAAMLDKVRYDKEMVEYKKKKSIADSKDKRSKKNLELNDLKLKGIIKPKKARSSYIFFSKAVREQVQNENPHASFGDISKITGQLWTQLGDRQKVRFNVMAIDDKKRFEADNVKYLKAVKKHKEENY